MIFIKRNINALKRQYGTSIILKQLGQPVIDTASGITAYPDAVEIVIKKAIEIPKAEIRNFILGGDISEVDSFFYIANNDLPKDFILNKNDTLISDNFEYTQVEAEKIGKDALVIRAKRVS